MRTAANGAAMSAPRAVCQPGGTEIALMHHGMNKINIGVCETQPVTAEGLRVLLASQEELTCRWIVPNLMVGLQLARQQPVHALLVDKGFGPQAVGLAITEVNACVPGTGVVVWGNSMSESEALRLLQSGARGLLRKTSDLATVTACLRNVAAGATWMDDCVFRDASRAEHPLRGDLTAREQQVLDLVEQGLKNKEIASELGIRPGTVKIHLKHIFEKTGVHGRYGLALSGLRHKSVGLLAPAPELQRSA